MQRGRKERERERKKARERERKREKGRKVNKKEAAKDRIFQFQRIVQNQSHIFVKHFVVIERVNF